MYVVVLNLWLCYYCNMMSFYTVPEFVKTCLPFPTCEPWPTILWIRFLHVKGLASHVYVRFGARLDCGCDGVAWKRANSPKHFSIHRHMVCVYMYEVCTALRVSSVELAYCFIFQISFVHIILLSLLVIS